MANIAEIIKYEGDNSTFIWKHPYDAVKYSDSMSNEALGGIETQITLKFNKLSKAAEEGNIEAVKNVSEEMIVLIADRNKKCKLLK